MIPQAINIEIEKFIFHVVHHGEDEPILMNNTPLGAFEVFFKKRISEILEGNRFLFTDSSLFLEKIKSIEDNEDRFIEVSKNLAIAFHQHQDRRIKPGVMILIIARVFGVKKYILIKYDHEDVITYKTRNNEAVLEEISNTFSKNKDSLQKAVVIDLNDTVMSSIVLDKSDRANITDFFKGFLGVKRIYDNKVLTEKVRISYLETIKAHKSLFPADFTSQASMRFYQVVQSQDNFSEEGIKEALFGAYYTVEVGRTFKKKLKSADVSGEEFRFDKSIRKPKKTKLMTQEGVSIQYSDSASDTVTVTNLLDRTEILIKTAKLLEE